MNKCIYSLLNKIKRQHNVSREKNELISRSKNVTIEKNSDNYDSPKIFKISTKFYKNNGNNFWE